MSIWLIKRVRNKYRKNRKGKVGIMQNKNFDDIYFVMVLFCVIKECINVYNVSRINRI